MYLANGLFRFIQNGSNSHLFIVMVALFFAFWGDVLLLFVFKYGGISFSICGSVFTVFCISNLVRCKAAPSFYLIGTGITLLFYSFFILAEKRNLIYIKKGKFFSYTYMLITTLQGAFGISLALCERSLGTLLLGVGLALFMISDYFLAVYRFPSDEMPRKTVNLLSRISSIAYFPGLLLISESVKYWG